MIPPENLSVWLDQAQALGLTAVTPPTAKLATFAFQFVYGQNEPYVNDWRRLALWCALEGPLDRRNWIRFLRMCTNRHPKPMGEEVWGALHPIVSGGDLMQPNEFGWLLLERVLGPRGRWETGGLWPDAYAAITTAFGPTFPVSPIIVCDWVHIGVTAGHVVGSWLHAPNMSWWITPAERLITGIRREELIVQGIIESSGFDIWLEQTHVYRRAAGLR